MAKLRAGILGTTSGKVSNVVASTWKGVNYIREKVIPANPNTANQQRVRGTLRNLILIGRGIMTQFVRTYWNNLVKGTPNSGFSKFVGYNQKAIQLLENYQDVKLATGDLEPLNNAVFTENTAQNKVDITWSKTVVSNGALTDVVTAYVFVPERNYLYSQVAPTTRTSETISVSIPAINTISGKYYAYVTAMKADKTLFSTTQGHSFA